MPNSDHKHRQRALTVTVIGELGDAPSLPFDDVVHFDIHL